MDVQYTCHVRTRGVNCTMDQEACSVHRVRARRCFLTRLIDLHEIRCGHFVEEEAVGVNEEAVRGRSRKLRGSMCEDEVVPTEMPHEAVTRGQVDAQRALRLAPL